MGEVCYEAVKQEMLDAESEAIVKLLMGSIVVFGRAKEEEEGERSKTGGCRSAIYPLRCRPVWSGKVSHYDQAASSDGKGAATTGRWCSSTQRAKAVAIISMT
jgi:hypothetical protein